MKKPALILFLSLLIACWTGPLSAAKVQFRFSAWAGPELRVFVSRPTGLAADRPVVFVMHGNQRNAKEYRDQWHALAIAHDFLVLVPEFRDADFPGSESYNYGNVVDAEGAVRPESQWAFSAIEQIFDDARRRFSLETDVYAIYGHSAGAQFVHRFLFHVPQARLTRAVAANAGWYTMPDPGIDFPYGLSGSAIRADPLAAALGLQFTILLGDADTDPNHPSLRRTPEAMAQGGHRFARGQAFFEAARSYAAGREIPFNWQLVTVPGADHDNRLMAPAAVPYLLGSD